ncbi:FAD-dependent monooxygenase [Planosporangium mesophilum]|uniref:Oxidoreductase n=1 Tax=Planosporangium mesophilum TaxID=689768 RepID=A0A8J3X2L1_9ACTN|nr:FAD-dependent monooxygenase [Planosporangium mesophilum]NJC85908.1 pentachlorophenol monooxygenase [Planosporangium mesophilum]GII25041.1 oxidoreductase [Planosporangium mesophilum]
MSSRVTVVGGVIVIGAGPVGQTAALLLARWGVAVTVVDERPGRDQVGSRSICQQRDVLDIWEAVGAGRRIADEGVTWERARTYYRDTELFCLTFAYPGRSAFPPFVNISQARTEEILDARIAASPLITVHWGHEVTGIAQDGDGVTVTCRTPDGGAVLRAPYAIACAGGRGEPVRRALGLTFAGRSFDDHFLICDLRADLGDFARERRFYFDPAWNPGRQVLIHPCPGSTYRIDWQVPADFDLDAERRDGTLERRIRQIIGDRPYEIVWSSVYRFHSRLVDRMRVGRVLVAGDCAHLVAPFGARGLNSGVQDAENAAWKLAFVLRGWSPPSLLDSYHTERMAAAAENLAVTGSTMDFLVPHSGAARRRRLDVLERALTDPAARAEVDSGRLAEPYWYVDSPLTTPHPTRVFTGRPARGQAPPVVPGVLVPDAPVTVPHRPEVTRLRQLVRDGILVLTAGDPGVAPGAPVRVLSIPDIDPTGLLAEALDARPGEAYVIRPDGHLAAVVGCDDAPALSAAVCRVLGGPS